MAFFTDMKRSLTETGKQVAQKTKELSDTVQLKAQLSREKEALNRQYAAKRYSKPQMKQMRRPTPQNSP